jgi:hypothetical protein
VASGALDALERDDADVVVVAQKPMKNGSSDRDRRAAGGGPATETTGVEQLTDLQQRVVAAGAELEGFPHEWTALWIEDDRPYLAALDQFE